MEPKSAFLTTIKKFSSRIKLWSTWSIEKHRQGNHCKREKTQPSQGRAISDSFGSNHRGLYRQKHQRWITWEDVLCAHWKATQRIEVLQTSLLRMTVSSFACTRIEMRWRVIEGNIMRERSKMKTRERNKIMKKAKLSIPKKKNRETTFFLIIFPDREEIRGEAAERTEWGSQT